MRDTFLLVRFSDDTPQYGLVLTADFREEDGRWLAECIETGTATYASKLEEAHDELAGAVTLQLDEIERLGYIRGFLEEHGVRAMRIVPRRHTGKPSGPTWVSAEQSSIDLVTAQCEVNAIKGRDLIRLLVADGWIVGSKRTHGVFLHQHFPDETFPRSTVVPDKADDLPDGTLGAILGVKQTGLGKTGLNELIKRYS